MSKVNAIKASAEIINPNMDQVEKVAMMARICYRSEQASGPESDKRLIRSCISKGHTSVMEHGLMGVFFDNKPVPDKQLRPDWDKAPGKVVSDEIIWESINSLDIKRYVLDGVDDDKLVDKFDPEFRKEHPDQFATLQCKYANLRAWLNIESDIFDAAIASGDPMVIGFVTALVKASLEAFPSVFCELHDALNKRIASLIVPGTVLATKLNGETADLTVDKLYDLCAGNKHRILAAPMTNRASLSVIFTTERAVTHELVRHRADTAFSQESQRWVNYNKKGFDFIIPSLDPVKYEKSAFSVAEEELLPNIGPVKSGLEVDGSIPQDSSLFEFWKQKMEDAVSSYEIFSQFNINPNEEKIYSALPPEFCRCVLPNSCATKIGVTFTVPSFSNFMHWRLGPDAYWPFRSLVGRMIVYALDMQHPFFSNFHPNVIKTWLKKISEQRICVDTELMSRLVRNQDERLEAIRARNAKLKAEREAAKKDFDAATGRVIDKAAAAAKAAKEMSAQ